VPPQLIGPLLPHGHGARRAVLLLTAHRGDRKWRDTTPPTGRGREDETGCGETMPDRKRK
jgi:hypothetical protein